MSAIKQIVESAPAYLPTFSETVDAILARELKYCKPVGKEMANGEFVGVLTFDTNWLRNIDERVAVQYALNQALWYAGKHRTSTTGDERPMMFSPLVVPFHVADDSGTPSSQLRVFFYRAKQDPADKRLPMSTIVVRCEPYGTVVKFDAESQYAAQVAAQEDAITASSNEA